MSPPYWKLYIISAKALVCSSPKRVPRFVQAGQVKHGFPQQGIPVRRVGRRREYVYFGTPDSVHQDRTRLSVQAAAASRPEDANLRLLPLRDPLQPQFSTGSRLPGFHGPLGQFRVARTAPACRLRAGIHPIFQGRALPQSAAKNCHQNPQHAHKSHFHCAVKMLNSYRPLASRSEQNTSVLPSGENSGNDVNPPVPVTCSNPEPSTLIRYSSK